MEALHEAVRGITVAEVRRSETVIIEVQRQVAELERQLSQRVSKIESVVASFHEQTLGLQNAVDLMASKQQVHADLGNLWKQVTEMQGQLGQKVLFETDVANVTRQVGLLEANASEFESSLTSIREQTMGLRDSVVHALSKQEFNVALGDMRDELNKIRDEADQKNETLQEVVRGVMASEVRRGQEQVTDFQEMQRQFEDIKRLLSRNTSEYKSGLANMQAQAATLQNSVSQKISKEQLDATIASMRDQIANIRTEEFTKEFRRDQDKIKADVADRQREMEQNISNLAGSLTNVQKQAATLQNSMDQRVSNQQLENALGPLKNLVADIQGEVDKKMSKQQTATALQSVRQQIENTRDIVISRLPEDLTQIQDGLDQRTASMERAVAGLLPRIESLTQQQNATKQQHEATHSSLRGQIDSIQGRVTGIQGEIDESVSRSELESTVTVIQERLVGLHGSIDERVSSPQLESAIAGIRDNFAGLENAMNKKVSVCEHEATHASFRKHLGSFENAIIEKASTHQLEITSAGIREEIASVQTALANKVSEQQLREAITWIQEQMSGRTFEQHHNTKIPDIRESLKGPTQ